MSTDDVRRFYVQEVNRRRERRWQITDRTGFMAPTDFGGGTGGRQRAAEVARARNECEYHGGHVFAAGKKGCVRCDATPEPDVVYLDDEGGY